MKKTQDTAPTPRSARGFIASALAVTGMIVGCTESSVMPDALGFPDAAAQQADAATIDSGPVVDVGIASADAASDAAIASADAASVDAAIASADAASVDVTVWEDDAGPDTNPYLRG